MTQEEKAKRYDEAINIAKRIFSEEEASNVFRELKENKDERIRKYLFYQLLDNPPKDINEHHLWLSDVLAWLKKQGELAIFLSKIQLTDSVTREKDGTLVNITEQARAVLTGGKEINHTFRERNKNKDRRIRKYLIYQLLDNPPKDIYEHHLWLSDVLAWLKKQDELAIFLSQIKVGDMLSRNEIGVIVNYSQLERMDKCAAKKKMKKIDNEDFNGEDYGIDSLYHAQRILEKTLGKVDGYQSDDGILEHKCAITAVKKLYEQKPVTNIKEDEKIRKYLIGLVLRAPRLDAYKHHLLESDVLHWLGCKDEDECHGGSNERK